MTLCGIIRPAFFAPSLHTAMNELDNHDHSRFLTRTNHRVEGWRIQRTRAASEGIKKSVLREAAVIQMTWPGAPTLYYGDEAGVCGFTDPDSRRTYPWGREDQELIRFYKEIIHLHRRYSVLAKGSLKALLQDYNILAYGRFDRTTRIVVAVNNRSEAAEVEIPVWETGMDRRLKEETMTEIFRTDRDGFSSSQREHPVVAGLLAITLPPEGAVVLYHHYARTASPLFPGPAEFLALRHQTSGLLRKNAAFIGKIRYNSILSESH